MCRIRKVIKMFWEKKTILKHCGKRAAKFRLLAALILHDTENQTYKKNKHFN